MGTRVVEMGPQRKVIFRLLNHFLNLRGTAGICGL